MTNFGLKNDSMEINNTYFFILPMVAISQRSIPKDQLYKKKDKETVFCTQHN